MKYKVGDKVQVISGKDKGTVGQILKLDSKNQKAIVKGVNIITKHLKPKAQGQEGKIDKLEAPIHISNILLFSEKAGKGVKFSTVKNGKSKDRICKKTNTKI